MKSRSWQPTIPERPKPIPELETPLVKPGDVAAGIPTWLNKTIGALNSLLKNINDIPNPTYLSKYVPEKLDVENQLRVSLYNLPVDSFEVIDREVLPQSEGIGNPTQWWAGQDQVTVEVIPSDISNRISLDTFGESEVRVETSTYDSGWVTSAWRRSIPFPLTQEPVRISIMNPNSGWAGYSSLVLERVQYQSTTLVTIGKVTEDSLINIESVPEGTNVVVEWSETPNGPWSRDRSAIKIEESINLNTSNSNLDYVRSEEVHPDSVLWCGNGGWLFESFSGKLIVDQSSGIGHEAGSPGLWKGLDSRLINRGIIGLTTSTVETITIPNVPEGYSWRISTNLDCLRSSTGTYEIQSDLGTRCAVYLNGSLVPITSDKEYTLRFQKGLNRLEFYGRRYGSSGTMNIQLGLNDSGDLTAKENSVFRGVHYIHRWYAVKLGIGTEWPQTPWYQDSGLTRPIASYQDGILKTSIGAVRTFDLATRWGSGFVLHNPEVAKSALLIGPRTIRNYARLILSGNNDRTPVVKVKL